MDLIVSVPKFHYLFFNYTNTNGSFTVADLNSFLSP